MAEQQIPEEVRALHDKVVAINHVKAVASAVSEFTKKNAKTYMEVQDGLRDAFFHSEYGKVMYAWHLDEVNKKISALSDKDKEAKYLAAATKKVDTEKHTTQAAQAAEAQVILGNFTDAEKSGILSADKDLHSAVVGSAEYKYAVSAALPYVAQIKEAFLLTESAIPGKKNYDLIATAGRNMTMYDQSRVEESDLAEVLVGSFDWKAHFSDEDKGVVALQVRAGTPDQPSALGAFVGGLANTIDFGDSASESANIKAFIKILSSDAFIDFARAEIIKTAPKGENLSALGKKNVAGLMSTKLLEDLPAVVTLWPPLETVVEAIKSAIDKDQDNAHIKADVDAKLKDSITPLIDNLRFDQDKGEFFTVPLDQVQRANILREGKEELFDLTSSKNAKDGLSKALKGLSGKDANTKANMVLAARLLATYIQS